MENYLDRIKMMKSSQRLTNEQLSEKSGIPLGTLSKILAGMSDSPKLSNLVAICNALGCSVEYIVNGTPENKNNFTLSPDEILLMESYRTLDMWGKSLVKTVIEKESDRVRITAFAAQTQLEATALNETKAAKVLRPVSLSESEGATKQKKRDLKLFELPVSAGAGVYLDEEQVEIIQVPVTAKTASADYALRISGNSMEPKYHNGDILLVQSCDWVGEGELGIFLLDGCGFFKVYGGDRLISLNPSYSPILLKDYSNVLCKGRVIGRLKRK